MNKSVKKMLLFLALLVAVIVIISVIYLLAMQPSGSSNVTPSPSASVSASASAAPSPSESVAPSPKPTDVGSVTTEETADGTKYNITVPGSFVSYSVVADSKIFDHSRTDGSDTFMDVSEAGEFLSISFIEGSKATDLAPSFLDQLIKYTDFEQSGENYIPGTEISGETVTANDGNTAFTAWLVDTDKGVLAVVISYNLANKDAQTTKLNKILGTLTINQ